MQQPSTRTGGTMTTAMAKLGGEHELISGMASSSEAKGEASDHTWVAFSTQADALGLRSKENDGPYRAARAIKESFDHGKFRRRAPIIKLGNGTDEHPTQALGDLYTIAQWQNFDYDRLTGMTLAIVGDHDRYRAFHSLMIGATALGMNVIAVESEVSRVPWELATPLGERFSRTSSLDDAMKIADVLYVGRNPDEYTGRNRQEKKRSRALARAYAGWVIDNARLQQMRPDAIVLHPRPIKNELARDVEGDPRMKDVGQMEAMVPMRMAIIARALGKSIAEHADEREVVALRFI
jgi:aspartate carbamoyltransferase catalytic subunit